jgi:hypothetical protein
MSINSTSVNVVATQLEKVDPKLPYFMTKAQSNFAKLFQKASDKHQVSAWVAGTVGGSPLGVSAYRVPVMLNRGGDYQAVSLDGGDLGTGSMMGTAYMTLGYFSNDMAYNVPTLANMATKNRTQAITNVLQTTIGSAIDETALYNEIGLFQDSTGVLANATSKISGNGNASTSVVYQLETTSFGPNRLRGNQTLVDITNAGGTVLASNARVTNINYPLGQVTILVSSAAGYSPTNTDQLVFPGMAPVSSTISAGSWRNGIYTFNTTNTTGSLLGLSYATAYELACNQVNANSGFLTPSVLFSGKSQLTQRRDDDAFAKTIGVCHTAQRTSWYLQGVTIANQFIRPGESAKSIDLAGQGTMLANTFEACDVIHHVSRYANKSRVDWFVNSNFGWVNLDEISFFQSPEGQRMFVGRNPTTGNPQAGYQFYIINTMNLYSCDPGCAVVNYSLAIPNGQ